jgi:hypothetical protein
VAEGAGDGSRKEIEARVLETKVNTLSCAIAVAPLSPAAAATTQIEALEECPRGYRAWAAPLLKLEAGRRRMGREEEERESGRGRKDEAGPQQLGCSEGVRPRNAGAGGWNRILQNRFQQLLEPLQQHFLAHFEDADLAALTAGDSLTCCHMV